MNSHENPSVNLHSGIVVFIATQSIWMAVLYISKECTNRYLCFVTKLTLTAFQPAVSSSPVTLYNASPIPGNAELP